MGQQFYVIRRNPAPGTPAFTAKQERDTKRGKSAPTSEAPVVAPVETRPPVRQQPRKKPRSQRGASTVGSPSATVPPVATETTTSQPPAAPVAASTPKQASGGATAARRSNAKSRGKPRSRR
jgi:YidC/Oxa1 family membrane protein insertase